MPCKNIFRKVCIASLLILSHSLTTHSQSNSDSPVEHMNLLNEAEGALQKKYLSYMSVVAHGNSARRMEKRREEVIRSIQESIQQVSKVRPYKGDAALRNTYSEYLKLLLTVFKEDYHKIVDMEEIAEQSYDNMEAYLLAQERASEKLNEAASKIEPAFKEFAARHGVNLVDPEKESKISKKLRIAGEVNEYYHKVYLIFFKSNHQEGYLIKAIEAYDVNAVEQNRNTLTKYAEEGLQQLDTLRPFHGDGSLRVNCRKVLEFYKQEAATMSSVTDFLLKRDEFEKIRKAMDAKPEGRRTQADIDHYNKAANEMNGGIGKFNKSMQDLNKSRAKLIDNWNDIVKRFMDSHVPNA